MMTPVALLCIHDPADWLFTPSSFAIKNMLAILDGMVVHNLDGSQIVNSVDGLSITWEFGFNKTHEAEIKCYNSGLVVGTSINIAADTWDKGEKVWWIHELSPLNVIEFENSLILTLAESLEYIRHFIWANHEV